MTAFPFGGHPTLAVYIDWARKHGCTARSGVMSDDDGRVHTITQIRCQGGKWVSIVGTRHDERLVPTTVAYLDRRLGLTSPFASIQGPDTDDGDDET